MSDDEKLCRLCEEEGPQWRLCWPHIVGGAAALFLGPALAYWAYALWPVHPYWSMVCAFVALAGLAPKKRLFLYHWDFGRNAEGE